MRIAHVSATFPPYYGGTGNVCYHNARVLAARGHDVHVFTATWPGEPDDPAGVTVHRLVPLARVGNAPVLPTLARLRGFDLIHLHYPFIGGGEFAAMSAWTSRTPMVATYHNDLLAPGFRGSCFSLYERVAGRQILRSARAVCAVSLDHARSSRLASHAGRSSGPKLVEMANGVDVNAFHPRVDGGPVRERLGIPASALLVAFVGALDSAHYFKRVDLLLGAFASLETRDAHLLVVGGGDLQPRYERMAAALGIASRTHFTSGVRHAELPPYVAACDVLVLPSDSVESFGMTIIEAMACGRPVIGTSIPGVRTLVCDGVDGLLASPGDLQALARSLEAVASLSSDRRAAMGMAGRQRVERNHAWERIGDRLEDLYQGVVTARVAVHAA